ncbi:hypothetical protein IT397_01845, partial [Candidatus Nomurabacteria bacterium]|nr:hypothetical protein [Candidatus Nomurabacteria bacterium]
VWGVFDNIDTKKYIKLLYVRVAVKSVGGGVINGFEFVMKYNDIISLENLLEAWKEFLNGKKSKKDVLEFQRNLMGNVISLNEDLVEKKYKHSNYEAFNISDPKPRNIHKAKVRDRLLHHAIYRILYPYFDNKFIHDSYSCRVGKGTHKAIDRFKFFSGKVSKNQTKTVWVLKCDIKKFFASINHNILLEILEKHISDKDILWLISEIVGSFHSTASGIGLPLGNLTSQLLVNIYMNEFDQFMKHKLKTRHYIRYADDFVIFSQDRIWLEKILLEIKTFLTEKLKLNLHPNKIYVKTVASSVDFLGWVHFHKHRVLRTGTKKRMLKNLSNNPSKETLQSYLGLLSHGNTEKLRCKALKLAYFNKNS